jgi:acetyltransferase-like isoleucine patch superfamily enzyme
MNPIHPLPAEAIPPWTKSSPKFVQRTAAWSIALLGWLPSSLGIKLRRQFYALFLKRMGHEVSIAKGVYLYQGQRLELGDRVTVSSGCRLINSDDGGTMTLGADSFLHEQVRIQAVGQFGQVVLRDRVTLERGVDFATCENGQIEIGSDTCLGPYTCVAGPGQVTIGNFCLIASHCGIYANNHIFTDLTKPVAVQGVTTKGIVIEDDCWLGTGVKVLDGVKIGSGSVIGAGAVVTRDIPPYSIAVGVPARVIRSRKTQAESTHSI